MLITNKILSLMGAGISPDPGDASVRVDPVLVPTFSPRSPMAAIITAPPAESFSESHVSFGQVTQGAAAPILDTVLTRLAAGLWQLDIRYSFIINAALSIADLAAGAGHAILLRRDAATGSVPLITVAVTTAANAGLLVTLNLPSDGWEIRFRAPNTQAGGSAYVSAAIVASRLS